MKINATDTQPVTVRSGPIEEVSEFTYLGSCLSTTGGIEEDMNAHMGKARGVFKAMEKLWRSNVLLRRTKVKL